MVSISVRTSSLVRTGYLCQLQPAAANYFQAHDIRTDRRSFGWGTKNWWKQSRQLNSNSKYNFTQHVFFSKKVLRSKPLETKEFFVNVYVKRLLLSVSYKLGEQDVLFAPLNNFVVPAYPPWFSWQLPIVLPATFVDSSSVLCPPDTLINSDLHYLLFLDSKPSLSVSRQRLTTFLFAVHTYLTN